MHRLRVDGEASQIDVFGGLTEIAVDDDGPVALLDRDLIAEVQRLRARQVGVFVAGHGKAGVVVRRAAGGLGAQRRHGGRSRDGRGVGGGDARCTRGRNR